VCLFVSQGRFNDVAPRGVPLPRPLAAPSSGRPAGLLVTSVRRSIRQPASQRYAPAPNDLPQRSSGSVRFAARQRNTTAGKQQIATPAGCPLTHRVSPLPMLLLE